MRRWRERCDAAAFGLCALLALAGCAHGSSARERPGTALARVYYYDDDQGLSVATAAAAIEQPVAAHLALLGHVLVDRIRVEQPEHVFQDRGGQPTGHAHDEVDAVTSASVTVAGGGGLDKTRVEGSAGVSADSEIAAVPVNAQLIGRVSSETDYLSYAGRLKLGTQLFQGNTELSLFVGYGHDRVDPIEPPPGESARWPATHEHLHVGAAVTQLLTSRLLVSAGVAATQQFGTLSNPYRRAIVRTSLFPEALPDERTRVTAFAGLSLYLGWDTALHAQQGFYFDSWDVSALIPQLALAHQFGARVLLTLRYRGYVQSAASFYAPRYDDLAPILSGDARLGRVRNHVPGLELAYTVLGERGGFGALIASASYSLSLLEYPGLGRSVTAQLGGAALHVSY